MRKRNLARGARHAGRAIRERLSYANVMATAAVFIVLGGSAWALAANSVGPRHIKRDAVRSKHIKRNQVRGRELRRDAVASRHIKDGKVKGRDLAPSSIGGGRIVNGSLTGADIASLPWAKLNDVPAGFADGVDNTGGGGPASDVACSGCIGTPDLGEIRRLGTASESPLRLLAAGFPALLLDPVRDEDGNLLLNVLSGSDNSAADGVAGATISGGSGNTADADRATVGGGAFNSIGGRGSTIGGGSGNAVRQFSPSSTIGGGSFNTVQQQAATIGGGSSNDAVDQFTTVGGGSGNTASDNFGTIGGGTNNTASGRVSTVPGGLRNTASGDFSFAAGRRADANRRGTFIWADSNDFDFGPSRADQFRARAIGGVEFVTSILSNGASNNGVFVSPGGGAWQSRSDRNSKENLEQVEPAEVLAKLAEIPIATWNWKSQDQRIRHMGPMAQDFADAFGLGSDRKTISTVDADGVALAAIQGLSRELAAERRKRRAEARRIARLEQRVSRLAR